MFHRVHSAQGMQLISKAAHALRVRDWTPGHLDPRGLRYVTSIAVAGHWFVIAVCLVELVSRPYYGLPRFAVYVLLLLTLIGLNGYIHYRLRTNRQITKLAFVVPLMAVLSLTALPVPVMAQQETPMIIIGEASLDGELAPVGTEVSAHDGGSRLGVTLTKEQGQFVLPVSRPTGETITLRVDGNEARTLDSRQWQSGKHLRSYDLHAYTDWTSRHRPGLQGPAGPAVRLGPGPTIALWLRAPPSIPWPPAPEPSRIPVYPPRHLEPPGLEPPGPLDPRILGPQGIPGPQRPPDLPGPPVLLTATVVLAAALATSVVVAAIFAFRRLFQRTRERVFLSCCAVVILFLVGLTYWAFREQEYDQRNYPKLDGVLLSYAEDYARGRFDPAEAASCGCSGVRGGNIYVVIHTTHDPLAIARIEEWLQGFGFPHFEMEVRDWPEDTRVTSRVPVSKLEELADLPDVIKARNALCKCP